MIYQDGRTLVFVDYLPHGHPAVCKFDRDLQKSYRFTRMGNKIVFAESYLNKHSSSFFKKKQSVIIDNWICEGNFGWLGVSIYTGRLGFVVGELDYKVMFYCIHDSYAPNSVGVTTRVPKECIERLPNDFQIECRAPSMVFIDL